MQTEVFDFQRDVVEASNVQPILVDFWAPWCGPCRVIGPVLEKLSQEPGVAWRLVKINVDENQDVARMFRVSSIPAVKLFYSGRVAGEFVGALPEGQIRSWLNQFLPSDEKEALNQAISLVENGQRDKAVKILEELVVTSAPDDAKVLLARLTVLDNPARSRELIAFIEEGHPAFDDAEVVRQLATLVALDTSGLPVDKARADFAIALGALKENNWPAALEGFIRSMTINRGYLDDLARKACIALFKYLGDNHPVTDEYRPKFSMALY